MRIPTFSVTQTKGKKCCRNQERINATGQSNHGHVLYDTKQKCELAGYDWGWWPPGGEALYNPLGVVPDEKGSDFYYTGVHILRAADGGPVEYTWSGQWAQDTDYEIGDLVVNRGGGATSTYHPEKEFFSCTIGHLSGPIAPVDQDGYWRKAFLKSYIKKGISPSVHSPDAYHAYNTKENKRNDPSHRYDENGNIIADAAEMGETYVEKKKIFHTYYNEENNPDQFYIAAQGGFRIYETCHGTRPLHYQGYTGAFNFYNATYPMGHYAPPYGETPTLTLVGSKAGTETINALTETDSVLFSFTDSTCCPELDDQGEMGMWGIRTVFPKKGMMVTFDQNRGDEHGIHAPYEECPPFREPAYYFDREHFKNHPGSMMAQQAGTFYNDNPFPNSCDIDGNFTPHVYKTQRCWSPGGQIYNGYKLKAGFPEMNYPTFGSTENKLDAGICKAKECETSQLLGYNFEGVQGGMGTGPGAAVNDSASFATYDPFIYWHFVFRYNHDSLWNQTQNTTSNQVVNFGMGANEGLIEDHLWEYRQCPNTPDFLPWSADIPIQACPSHYLDIPYYAAIGKFGFYGARFFNSCNQTVATAGNETRDQTLEFNYYTALKTNDDGTSLLPGTVTMKARKDRSGQNGGVMRINQQCYDVTYSHTNNTDDPTDMVLGATTPLWESTPITIDLKYDVYEWDTSILASKWEVKLLNTVTWKTLQFTITACENCANGGLAGIERARAELVDAIEGKFNKTMSEIRQMTGGVGQSYCSQSPACDPYLQHGSVAFNPRTTIDEPFDHLNHLLRSYSVRSSADNIHATEGKYSTFDSKVNIVRDFSAGVSDCDDYEEPPVKAGVCDARHYDTLLKISANEQRLAEFFVGNQGFFLWANYDHITKSNEYANLLTGLLPKSDEENHFKRCLHRLWRDFDELLLSLPNFIDGLDDPVIYYDKAVNGMYGNDPLEYSKRGLYNDMLFTNNRFRQFVAETEWPDNGGLFSLSDSRAGHTTQREAWEKLLDTYGHAVCNPGGSVNASWYKTSIEGKEKRLLTRFVENKFRGRAIDLYPTNQITFSVDLTNPYLSGKHWGNSKWGDSVVGSHYRGSSVKGAARFEPLPGGAEWRQTTKNILPDDINPGVMRQYFWGVYARESATTGLEQRIRSAVSQGGAHYYAGLYQDFSCGGDEPRAVYNAGGIALDADTGKIPAFPWVTKGHNDIGRVNQGFSCFSPIFIQEPTNIACKIGQRPTFRCQAVDYHTIPEDKIGKGYPEIDYWTNNLKLTNSKGKSKYPVEYKWYRVLAHPDRDYYNAHAANQHSSDPKYYDPSQITVPGPNATVETTLEKWFYADNWVLQEASVTGEWACMEGVSGRGTEDCTMFHPQATYTHDMVEGPSAYGLGGPGDRKYGEEHWSKLVDYKGEVYNIGSAKKQGWHRLWKSFRYIQGAYTTEGRGSNDPSARTDEGDGAGGAGVDFASAIPVFDHREANVSEGSMDYNAMMEHKYATPNKNGDERYLYFCVVSGRFGFRRSEYASLDIEDWLKIDFSIRNGAPVSIPIKGVSYSYTRVDQYHNVLSNMGNPQNEANASGPQSDLQRHGEIVLDKGWGTTNDAITWQAQWFNIPPFAGTERDPNQVWESEMMEAINMSNNCRSFAFMGREGYRGTTRTFRAPSQMDHQGTRALRAGWFEYGLLYPFGGRLSQAWGNALYSQSQLPVCRDYMMPKGCTAHGFDAIVDLAHLTPGMDTVYEPTTDHCGNITFQPQSTNLINEVMRGPNAQALGLVNPDGTQNEATMADLIQTKKAYLYHYTTPDQAVITTDRYAGVPPSQFEHQGDLYPWNEQDSYNWYWDLGGGNIGFHGKGVSWQFSNNLGTIKRFGHYVDMPSVAAGSGGQTLEDTQDVYFWAYGDVGRMQHEFRAAQRWIFSSSLAGVNCGWRKNSCGRYMLYFVEALHRFYLTCDPNGKKRTINKSFIAPGLRHGASACQYFTGGFPSSTSIKRTGLLGPYAYEWKISTHNRDRNGNGISESFYSTRFNRVMYLYDPPAIYGLWARQPKGNTMLPSVKRIRKLRKRAQSPGVSSYTHSIPYFFKGTRFGPHGTGKNGGCGSFRIGCVEQLHRPRRSRRYIPGDAPCDWYRSAERLGLDHGSNYGCSEQQLINGVCFDPCLSMKYNYGFFPGGKLLTINNYVRLKDGRHDAADAAAQAKAAQGGVVGHQTNMPNAASRQANSSQSSLNASQAAANPPGGILKKNKGSRFLIQLTNSVDDEEIAITRNRSMKFIRLIRGPWATPYRRIRASLIAQRYAPNVGPSKVLNDEVGDGEIYGHDSGLQPNHMEKYTNPQWGAKNKKMTAQQLSDTTVSPCNPYGADHCNYLTPTMHLGMDVQMIAFADAFGDTARRLGGGTTVSEEITITGEMLNQMNGFSSWLVTDMPELLLKAGIGAGVVLTGGALALVLAGLAASGSLTSVIQHYETQACGGDSSLFDALLAGMPGLLDPTTKTLLEQEIASRSKTSANGIAIDGILKNLDELHRKGQVIVI